MSYAERDRVIATITPRTLDHWATEAELVARDLTLRGDVLPGSAIDTDARELASALRRAFTEIGSLVERVRKHTAAVNRALSRVVEASYDAGCPVSALRNAAFGHNARWPAIRPLVLDQIRELEATLREHEADPDADRDDDRRADRAREALAAGRWLIDTLPAPPAEGADPAAPGYMNEEATP